MGQITQAGPFLFQYCHWVACFKLEQTLRVTPAMEAGLADHVWSLEELVGLLERKSDGVAA
jgi:hypothetical protein